MILFNQKMKSYSIIVAVLGIISLFVYFLTPFKSNSLGFLLGLLFSYVNLWTIYRKTITVGEAAGKDVHPSIFSLIIAGFGFVIRTVIALTAIWLAIRYPSTFNLFFVIVGFSLIYIIILIDMVSRSIRKR